MPSLPKSFQDINFLWDALYVITLHYIVEYAGSSQVSTRLILAAFHALHYAIIFLMAKAATNALTKLQYS
jgi:hypothetical protein